MKISLAILTAALCAAGPAFSADEPPAPRPAPQTPGRIPKIGVEEFDRLRQNKDAIVLDVRTEKEFKAGHIPGALHIDVRSSEFEEQIESLDKRKIYLVHCATGSRSFTASVRLQKKGFKQVFDFAPGFKGWEKAGKPVEN